MSLPTGRPRGNDTYYANLNEPNYDNLNEPYFDNRDHVPYLHQPTPPIYRHNLSNTPNANTRMRSMMPPPSSFQQRPDPVCISSQNLYREKNAPSASRTADANMPYQNHRNVPDSPFPGQQLARTPSTQSSNLATGSPSYLENQDNHHQTAGHFPQLGSSALGHLWQHDEESLPYSTLPNAPGGDPNAMTRRPSERSWNSGPENTPLSANEYGQSPQMRNPSNHGYAHLYDDATTNNQTRHSVNEKRTRTSMKARQPNHDVPDESYYAQREAAKENQRQGELEAQRAFQMAESQRFAFQNQPQRNAFPAQSDRGGNVSRQSFHRETEMGATRDLLPMGHNPSRQRSEDSAPGRGTPSPFGMQTGQAEIHPAHMHDGRDFRSSYASVAPSRRAPASLEEDELGRAYLAQRPGTVPYLQNNQSSPHRGRVQTPLPGPRLGGNVGHPQELWGNGTYHLGRGLSIRPAGQPPTGNVSSPYQYATPSREGRAVAHLPYQNQAPGAPQIAPAHLNNPPVQQDRYAERSRQPRLTPRRNMEGQRPSRNSSPQPSLTPLPAGRPGQLAPRNPRPQLPWTALTPAQRAEYRRRYQEIIDVHNRIPLQVIFASVTLPREPMVRLQHLVQLSPLIQYQPTSLTDIGPPITAAIAEAFTYFLNEEGFGQDFEEIAKLCETIPIEGPPVLALGADGGLEIQSGAWNHENDWWPLQGGVADQGLHSQGDGDVIDQWMNFQSITEATDEGSDPVSGGGRVLGEVDLDGMQFERGGGAGPSNSRSHARGQNADESLPDLPLTVDTFEGDSSAFNPEPKDLSAVDPFSLDPFADAGGPGIGGMASGDSGGGSKGKRKRDGNDGGEA